MVNVDFTHFLYHVSHYPLCVPISVVCRYNKVVVSKQQQINSYYMYIHGISKRSQDIISLIQLFENLRSILCQNQNIVAKHSREFSSCCTAWQTFMSPKTFPHSLLCGPVAKVTQGKVVKNCIKMLIGEHIESNSNCYIYRFPEQNVLRQKFLSSTESKKKYLKYHEETIFFSTLTKQKYLFKSEYLS